MKSQFLKQKAMVVVYWDDPKSTDRKILLLKRPASNMDGAWQPVTGNAEKGESFSEIALREAVEETGFFFSGAPRYLGLHFQFDGRWGPAEEKAFALEVQGESPPNPKLDPTEHEDFLWMSPSEAQEKVDFLEQREAILRSGYRPMPLTLDTNGTWWQEGEEITHDRTVALLHECLTRKEDGDFCVDVAGDQLPVTVQGVPLHIKSVNREHGTITLLPNRLAQLDPDTIWAGKDNILYCKVEGWKARFQRSAYYELCKSITEDKSSNGEYVLQWCGRNYSVQIPH